MRGSTITIVPTNFKKSCRVKVKNYVCEEEISKDYEVQFAMWSKLIVGKGIYEGAKYPNQWREMNEEWNYSLIIRFNGIQHQLLSR